MMIIILNDAKYDDENWDNSHAHKMIIMMIIISGVTKSVI